MEFKYIEELKNNGLNINDLPEDAQTGIDQLKNILKGLNMLEKSGKKPTQKTLRKIKAMDKWVCYEIYDHINETDSNSDEMPYEDEIDEIKDELIEETNDETTILDAKEGNLQNKLAFEIETEIKTIFDSGIKSMEIETIKLKAPKCYSLLFDTYDPESDNGINTTYYSLLENKNEGVFYINKK